jgi:hypothetical protein
MNIYLENDEYTLDRSQLIQRILSEIQIFLVNQLNNSEIDDNQYNMVKTKTKIGNVFNLDTVTIPINDVVLINQKYNDIDTHAQVLVNLSVSVREGVVGENIVLKND